ncbi:MAG: hypothetical protein E6R13_05430, partial [Spirochaetes bacterium]
MDNLVVPSIVELVKKEWSYGYTASSGFATEDRILVINNNIDNTIKNRTSTRIEGDCVTFTFNTELSDLNKIE